MRCLTLVDDHELCIRTFLKEIDDLRILPDKKSVLHVGAHMGEEVQAYRDHGYSPIYLVEANPEILPDLKAKFQLNQDVQIISVAVGDSEGEAEFIVHRTRKGGMESSGLLHLEKLGEIVRVFNSELRYRVPLMTIDRIVALNNLHNSVGLLVLDVQGAEMLALKGAVEFLREVATVICEVNLIQNYQSCVLEIDIDKFFADMGFTKQLAIYHELYEGDRSFPAWGECLYYRNRHK
jgi:FkbM family methyltransferase